MKPDLYYVLKRGNEYMTIGCDGFEPTSLAWALWRETAQDLRAELHMTETDRSRLDEYRIVCIIRKGSLTWTLREVNKTLQALRPLMEPTWTIEGCKRS